MPRIPKQHGERGTGILRRSQKENSSQKTAKEKAVFEFTDDQDEDFKLPQGKRTKTTRACEVRDSKQGGDKQTLLVKEISRPKPADNSDEAQFLDSLECDNGAISYSTEMIKLAPLKMAEANEKLEPSNSGLVGDQSPDFPTLAELTSQSKGIKNSANAKKRKFIDSIQSLNYRNNLQTGECSSTDTLSESNINVFDIDHTSNDAAIAEELQREENSKNNQESVHAVDFDVCEFCFKDIKHLNSIRKRQHINRCCDSITASLKSAKEAEVKMEMDKSNLLLTCPICGKVNKTEQGKKVHLKQCSKKHNVSTVELINLLKSMEHGSMPPNLNMQEDPRTKDEVSHSSNTIHVKAIKGSNRKRSEKALDENAQIALALSASECSLQSDENRRTKLAKKANMMTEVPDIIMISEEDRQKRMEERATVIVKEDCSEEISCTPALNPSKVAAKYCLDIDIVSNSPATIEEKLNELQTSVNTEYKECTIDQTVNTSQSTSSIVPGRQPLWDLASSTEDLVNQRPFYVTELLPVLGLSQSRPHAVDKAKGSADCQRAMGNEAPVEQARSFPCSKTEYNEDIDQLPSNTQLVGILTDLGEEQEENGDLDGNQRGDTQPRFRKKGDDAQPHFLNKEGDTQPRSNNKENKQPCPGDGFIRNVFPKGVQDELFSLQAEAHREISVNFQAALFSPDFSDLVVHCRHGVEVPAHKVILAARSTYLKGALSGNVNRLDLKEFSELAVKVVLRNIYCGELTLDSAVVTEVEEIAKRFRLGILQKACGIYVDQDPTLVHLPDKMASDTVGEPDNAAFLSDEETEEGNPDDIKSEDHEAESGDDDWIQASVAVLLRTSFVHGEHPLSNVADTMETDNLAQIRRADRSSSISLDTEEEEVGQQATEEPNTCSPPLFEGDTDSLDYQNSTVLTLANCDDRESKSRLDDEEMELAHHNMSPNDPIWARYPEGSNIVIINSDSDMEDESLFETQKYCGADVSSPTGKTLMSIPSTCNSPALCSTEPCVSLSRMRHKELINRIGKLAVVEEASKVSNEAQLLSSTLEGGSRYSERASQLPISSCITSEYSAYSSIHAPDFESLHDFASFKRTSGLRDENTNSPGNDEVFRNADCGNAALEKLALDTDESGGEDDADDDATLPAVFRDQVAEKKIEIKETLTSKEGNINAKLSMTDALAFAPSSQTSDSADNHDRSDMMGTSDNLDASEATASHGVASFWNVSHCDFEDDGGYNCDIMEFDIPSSPSPLSSPSSEAGLADCAKGTRTVSTESGSDHLAVKEVLVNADGTSPSTSKVDLDDSLVQLLDDIDNGNTYNLSITVENTTSSQREVHVTPEKVDRQSPESDDKQRKFGPGDCKHPETGETITPFPNYAQMDSPELIAKAKRFALRQTLPKKVLVAKLEEIYKYQHNFTVWEATPIQQGFKQKGAKRKPGQEDRKRCRKVARVDRGRNGSDPVCTEERITSEDRSQGTAGAELEFCHQFQTGSSSSDESEQDEFERSVLSHDDDTETLTKKQNFKGDGISLKKQLTDLIRTDKSLYVDILTYKPLNFDALRKSLREKGVSCSKEQLLDYLDQQCICFTAPRPGQSVGKLRRRRMKAKQNTAPD